MLIASLQFLIRVVLNSYNEIVLHSRRQRLSSDQMNHMLVIRSARQVSKGM